jgi:hypothetical protein
MEPVMDLVKLMEGLAFGQQVKDIDFVNVPEAKPEIKDDEG